MDNNQIDAYYKGRNYAAEADKHIWMIDGESIRFQGNHAEHQLKLVEGRWVCDCEFFARRHAAHLVKPEIVVYCPHIIAVALVARAVEPV
jgi:hypothetical protein